MKYKKITRLIALAFMIGLACILPVPLEFKTKDNLPKNVIEQVEIKDDNEEEDVLELFKK